MNPKKIQFLFVDLLILKYFFLFFDLQQKIYIYLYISCNVNRIQFYIPYFLWVTPSSHL